MARTYSNRLTHPIGGAIDAGDGLFDDLPMGAFAQRDAGVYFNDFTKATDFVITGDTVTGIADWEANEVGTVASASVAIVTPSASVFDSFGTLRVVTGTANSTGYNILGADANGGLRVWPVSITGFSSIIACEWRVTTSTATGWTANNWFFGLADSASTTTPMASTGALGASNLGLAGFHHLASTGDGIPLLKAAGDNGTVVTVTPSFKRTGSTQTLVARTASTSAVSGFTRFGLRIEGSTVVKFYIDGIFVGATTLASAYTTSSILSPALSVVTHSSATNSTFHVDYVSLSRNRG